MFLVNNDVVLIVSIQSYDLFQKRLEAQTSLDLLVINQILDGCFDRKFCAQNYTQNSYKVLMTETGQLGGIQTFLLAKHHDLAIETL